MPIARNYANIEAGANAKKTLKHIRYSVFLVTWNSNKYVSDMADPKFIEMETAAETYFNKLMDNISDYIKFKTDGKGKEKVKSIDVDCAFEIGGAQRRFHAHMYVKIDHYIRLQLDIDRIRKETSEQICDGYCNVIGSNESSRSMQDYIHKFNNGRFPEK